MMNTTKLMLLLIVALIARPAQAKECGTVRWQVKTGIDSDANLIVLDKSHRATINTLIRKKPLGHPPHSARVKPTEVTLYVVTATMTDYKRSADDHDYHIVLDDDKGHTMIAEIPDPSCVRDRGPLASKIKNARQQFDSEYTATGSFKKANRRVKVTGVGFYDHIHGQRGVAPNGIELHPVLNIEFLN